MATKIKFTEEEKAEIIRLYVEEGLSVSKISNKFKRGTSTIKSRLILWDIPIRDDREIQKLPKHLKNKIIKLYEEDQLSIQKITDILGISYWTVKDRLIRWGVLDNSRGNKAKNRKLKQNKEKIINLYINEDYSAYAIGEIYGCSESAILYNLNNWNIDTSPKCKIEFLGKDKKYIISSYLRGNSPADIADKLDVGRDTIVARLIEWEVWKGERRKITFPKKEMEKIIKNYENGDSTIQIANRRGVSVDVILRRLKEHNISLRGPRKYSLNDDFFEGMNKLESATYWTAFIMGDGNVCNNVLTIGLASRDINHLHKFVDCLNSDYPVKKYGNTAFLTITSNKVIEDLAKHNIVPRKTFITKPPKLNVKTERHFWRGLVDSDGWVSWDGKYPKVGLCGTYEICEGFRQFVIKFSDTKAKVCKHGNIYKFSTGGKHAFNVIKELYGDATIYLDRKHQKAMNVLKNYL